MNRVTNYIRENFYILIAWYAMFVFISNDLYLPAMPGIAKEFGVSSGDIQIATMWWLLGAVVVGLFLGPISDMVGRKIPILICGLTSILGNIVCGVSTDPFILFVGNVLEGTAGGAWGAVCVASIIEYYHGEKSVHALSVVANLVIFAPLVGPLISAGIMVFLPWPFVFYANALFYGLLLILMMLYMPETLPPEKRHKDADIFAPIKLLYKVGQDPVFLTYCLSHGFTRITYVFWIVGSPVMLMENLQLDRNEYALWQMPAMLAYFLGNIIVMLIINKVELRKMLIVVHLIFGAMAIIGVVAGVLYADAGLYTLIFVCFIIFFPYGLLNAPRTKYVVSIPLQFRGTSSTFFTMLGATFEALGVFIAVLLHGSPISTMIIYMSSFVLASVSIGLIAEYFLTRRSNRNKLLEQN